MTTTGQNFEIYQGESKILNVTLYDVDNNVMEIIGFRIVWVLYRTSAQTNLITKTTDDGIIITETKGVFEITLNTSDTQSIPTGEYHQQCEVFDTDSNLVVVLTGEVKILKNRMI